MSRLVASSRRRRPADQVDQLGIEALGAELPRLDDGHVHLRAARAVRHGPPDVGEHPLRLGGLGVADVQGEAGPVGEDAGQVWRGLETRRGGLALGRVRKSDLVDGDGEHGGAHEGVLALSHRRRAGVRGLAAHLDHGPAHLEAPGHHAQRDALVVQDRPLLDVHARSYASSGRPPTGASPA